MKQTAEALYNFASSFGWDAYPEQSVPNDAELPYITYTLREDDFRVPGLIQMRLWNVSEGYTEINSVVDKIELEVRDGKKLFTESGIIYLYKGSPWCQFQPSEEPNLKIAYLNFIAHFATH